jgi:ferritin
MTDLDITKQGVNIKVAIAKYVERNDVKGLAEFFRAYTEDEYFARQELIEKIDTGIDVINKEGTYVVHDDVRNILKEIIKNI